MASAIVEKIKRLLSLSKSANINEAMAAAAIANRLIEEHRLSEADLSELNDPIVEDDTPIYTTSRITVWKEFLISGLAKHYGCVSFNVIYRTPRKTSNFKLVGKKSDIEIVRYMFSLLVMKCKDLADKNAKGMGRIYVASYCHGFVVGVLSQLKSSSEKAKGNASSTALAVVNSRFLESNEFLNNKYKKINDAGDVQSKLDVLAYHNGVMSGRNLHLGKSLEENSSSNNSLSDADLKDIEGLWK